MNALQEIFDSENFKKLTTKLIVQKIEESGYHLTDKQLASIEEQVAHSERGTLEIELPDEEIDIEISVEDDDIDRVLDEHIKNLPQEMEKLSKEAAETILENLRQRAPEMFKEHKELKNGFEHKLWQRWGEAFDLLKMFTIIAFEAGEDFNKEFRESAAKEQDYQFDVLTRLHARACQIANEILTLLTSGYADGAHARWRSIHEIAVVGFFVSKFGEDVAERYLLHNNVESYKAALQYQRHHAQLGYEPISDQEMDNIQSSYQWLIDRFGSSYANSYGWASQALGKAKPTFSDIEDASGLSHWRPHYKFASDNVHANPKGMFSKLGLYSDQKNLLLAGASDTGFTDPAHSTAISLLQITTSLLTLKPNIDRLSICYILSTLAEEIGDTFLSIQKEQKETV